VHATPRLCGGGAGISWKEGSRVSINTDRVGKMFFFEKENQETFDTLRTLPANRAPRVKRLLRLFYRKEDLPS